MEMINERNPERRSNSFRKAITGDGENEKGTSPRLSDFNPTVTNESPSETKHDAINPEFEQEEEKSPEESWRSFAENSTLHGIRLVFVRSSPWVRLVWLVFLLAFTGIVISAICTSIIKYFGYPIATLMKIEYPTESMPFPAVTVCPMTTLTRRKISMKDNDNRFSRWGLNISACDVTASVRRGRPCGEALLCCCSNNDYLDGSSVVDNCTDQYKDDLLKVIRLRKESFNDREFWKAYGPDIWRMIIPGTCYFGSTDRMCSYKDFEPVITEFGACYSFNSGIRGRSVLSASFSGLSGGLFLMLDLQVEDHAFGWYSDGVRVLIHNQGEYVDPWNGVVVAPGAFAQISVSRKVYENKKEPYETKCDDSRILSGFKKYTSEGCTYECLSNISVKECGCRLPGVSGNSEIRVCYRDDQDCLNNVNSDDMQGKITCDCPLACDVVKYESSVSQATFPNPSMMKILRKSGFNKSDEYFRKNLVHLQIGYRFLSYEYFRQKSQYDSSALMGEIGGNMGLFLGCSILTIFEFIDFAIFMCRKRQRLRERKKNIAS